MSAEARIGAHEVAKSIVNDMVGGSDGHRIDPLPVGGEVDFDSSADRESQELIVIALRNRLTEFALECAESCKSLHGGSP